MDILVVFFLHKPSGQLEVVAELSIHKPALSALLESAHLKLNHIQVAVLT